MAGIKDLFRLLRPQTTYEAGRPKSGLKTLDDPQIESQRTQQGGRLVQRANIRTRWYFEDLEDAERLANEGQFAMAARLMRAAMADAVLMGILSTRTSGLIRLPKLFSGDAKICADLQRGPSAKDPSSVSMFDTICPVSELAAMAADGVLLGVAVAERVPIDGQPYKVLTRLNPEFLRYRPYDNRWTYNAQLGELEITPGDGRWVLHCPGGNNDPWERGLWRGIGYSWITKTHAQAHKEAFERGLANPAKILQSTQGATDDQRRAGLELLKAWGIDTVYGLTPGWEIKLLEAGTQGWETFVKTIADCNQDFILAIAGQVVTTTGGTGFANADVHKSIRGDLITDTAEGLAHTLNTQVLPQYVAEVYETIERTVTVRWKTDPQKDLLQAANTLVSAANAIKSLTEALALAKDSGADIPQLCQQFGIPVAGDDDGDGTPDEETIDTVAETVEPESLN